MGPRAGSGASKLRKLGRSRAMSAERNSGLIFVRPDDPIDRQRYPLLLTCGEIWTDFGVETFKQSLFHRKLEEGA